MGAEVQVGAAEAEAEAAAAEEEEVAAAAEEEEQVGQVGQVGQVEPAVLEVTCISISLLFGAHPQTRAGPALGLCFHTRLLLSAAYV